MDQDKDIRIRAEVRAAARVVFQKWGLEKTSMEDIAKATCRGKSTLYYYYKSKEDVFFDVAQEEVERMFSVVQSAVDAVRTAKEKLFAFVSTRANEIIKQTALYPVIIGELRSSDWFFRIHKLFDTEETRLLRNILEYGVRCGEFRLFNEIEVDSFAYLIACTIRSMEVDLIMGEAHLKDIDLIRMSVDLVVDGMKK